MPDAAGLLVVPVVPPMSMALPDPPMPVVPSELDVAKCCVDCPDVLGM
jgi:hypothetical protein